MAQPSGGPGFQVPHLEGSFRYGLTVSERESFGYNGNGGNVSFTDISGNAAYMSSSLAAPFGMIYSGGYLASTSGQPSAPYQSLALSQGLLFGRWSIGLNDAVSYLPQTPSVGLSGIPGVGDLGVAGVSPVPVDGQGILTNYATRVSNAASGSVQRNLTGKTSLGGSGTWTTLRFIDSAGGFNLDSDSYTGSGNLTHRIDARNSVSGNYIYTRYSYGSSQAFESQGVNLQYHRRWSRKVATDVSAGPQRSTSTGDTLIRPSLNAAVSANITYAGKATALNAGYSRGTNSGSGVLTGAHNDSVQAGASRRLGRDWSGTATAAYSRTTALAGESVAGPGAFDSNAIIFSAQANRTVGRSFSVYGSYSLQRQTTSGAAAAYAFTGLTQILGFGLTYSPAAVRLGRH